MKSCPCCNRSLKEENFSKCAYKSDGLQVYCKECSNIKRKAYYLENHTHERAVHKVYKQKVKARWIDFLKQQKCVDCGENRFYLLDLDFINAKDKKITIGEMVANAVVWDKIRLEMKKCEVRCANCRRARHFLNKLD